MAPRRFSRAAVPPTLLFGPPATSLVPPCPFSPAPLVRRLVLTDLDRGTVHEFRDADVRIGRDPACELPVVEAPAGAEIAGVHARLAPRATGWCLTDERTKGGTFVNHVRLVGSDQAILRTGDVIRLGAGAGARRYRVARIENVAAQRQAPPSPRTDAARDEAHDLRLAAGAVGGASVASAAALAPRASNAQLASGAAAGTAVATAAAGVAAARSKANAAPKPQDGANIGVAAAAGAVAGTVGVGGAVASASGGGLEQWRASRLFEAAGDTGKAAATTGKAAGSAAWVGVAAGAVAVAGAGAAGGYQLWRSDTAGPRVVIADVATTPDAPPPPTQATSAGNAAAGAAAAQSAARDAAAARLGTAAAAAGNILAELTAYYGGRQVRVTGIVLAEAGDIITVREAVRSPSGTRPDSVVAEWPHGGRHRAQPRSEGEGLGLLRLQGWRGQWLGTAAQGSAGAQPSWSAVVGFDREDPRPVVVAGEATVVRSASGVDVRGASERLLPGSALVDGQGHVIGLWTGSGRGVAIGTALALAGQAP